MEFNLNNQLWSHIAELLKDQITTGATAFKILIDPVDFIRQAKFPDKILVRHMETAITNNQTLADQPQTSEELFLTLVDRLFRSQWWTRTISKWIMDLL